MGLPINPSEGRTRVVGWEQGNQLLAPCSDRRQTASLIKMRINPLFKNSTFHVQPPFLGFWGDGYSIRKIFRLFTSDLA